MDDFWENLKGEITVFADGLIVGHERKRSYG